MSWREEGSVKRPFACNVKSCCYKDMYEYSMRGEGPSIKPNIEESQLGSQGNFDAY